MRTAYAPRAGGAGDRSRERGGAAPRHAPRPEVMAGSRRRRHRLSQTGRQRDDPGSCSDGAVDGARTRRPAPPAQPGAAAGAATRDPRPARASVERLLGRRRPRAMTCSRRVAMRILVTGGAGYVGSVSVEALLEARATTSSSSTTCRPVTGGRAGRGQARRRELRRPGRAGRGSSSADGSRRSSTAPRARSSASRSRTRRGTTATTSPAGSRCSRPSGSPASSASSSARPPPSTASRIDPDPRGRPDSGRSTRTARRSGRSRRRSPGTGGPTGFAP